MSFDIHLLDNNYPSFKEVTFHSRIFQYDHLMDHLDFCQKISTVTSIGHSVEGREIFKLKLGRGQKKILIWSQMHGDESTGSLAMFDIWRFLSQESFLSSLIKNKLEISFIPMLNPDGAERFKRRNAMNIDLNRDAIALQCPETRVLFQEISTCTPEVLFNLHDQRSLFHVGSTPKPAVISFLAPSEDFHRTLTQGRKNTMGFIARIVHFVKSILPGMIGRYSDEFYPTASGDRLQQMGYPCVLFEAGYHYQDREKQKARKYNALAILSGLYSLTQFDDFTSFYSDYFSIPGNDNKLLDKIYRNVQLKKNGLVIQADIGSRMQEIYNSSVDKLCFEERIVEIGDLSHFFAREEISDRKGRYLGKNGETYPELGEKTDFKLI
ncbi:M14 family zinc carboxypeptidase [Bacteroidetes bacterium endosymbiont of Geopemphigus sp.]|uniref:M14 family zinc carboxypeptidase n=1 Tax=Bacteroidetes bacterium endosymbiont of Geopemphigus sp. TaxID=2047937 RepID=UPI000CD27411|nr:M14 family zinc carboxypeptidase [Bacteroidetes bacterium endosymbiont of Geopemphigus sp.]